MSAGIQGNARIIFHVPAAFNASAMVILSRDIVLEFLIGINLRSIDLPWSELPTVNTPCLGEYCPDNKLAIVEAQFAAFA
jgi:hypothetical protein